METFYEVVTDEEGGRFDPISGNMNPTKKGAVAELQEKRAEYPDVYVAKVTYSRQFRIPWLIVSVSNICR